MQYYRLRFEVPKVDQPRVAGKLRALREQLDADIPSKDANDTLLLATWNIRDFAKDFGKSPKKAQRRGFGPRLPETLFYIAEIISRFDIVAVQEINDIREWEKVVDLLGPDWNYIATDITDTSLGGNGERLLYAYDTRKVRFGNIAGEIVLPNNLLVSKVTVDYENGKLYSGKQFRRSPFVARFQSNWLKFDLCTVHIYYGSPSGAKLKERIEEIDRVANYFGTRADRALRSDQAQLLLGDFNIVHPDHETMKGLTKNGFVIPKALDRPSNLDLTKYYDQIAFKTDPEVVQFVDGAGPDGKPNAGIFEIFENLFRDDEFDVYKDDVKRCANGEKLTDSALVDEYKDWRTYQVSDHKPMWVRLKTNDSDRYLKSFTAQG